MEPYPEYNGLKPDNSWRGLALEVFVHVAVYGVFMSLVFAAIKWG